MSARLSTRLPLACSGDMYAAVPITVPATVAPRVTVGEFSGSKLADLAPYQPRLRSEHVVTTPG